MKNKPLDIASLKNIKYHTPKALEPRPSLVERSASPRNPTAIQLIKQAQIAVTNLNRKSYLHTNFILVHHRFPQKSVFCQEAKTP